MHTPEDDFYLGRHLLENKQVSREALLECLFQIAQERKSAARSGYARPLGVLLVARGLITEEELNKILAARVSPSGEGRSLSEAEVGKLLLASGLMLKEEIDACVRYQQEMREKGLSPPRLGELVIQRGYATEQQVMRVLAYQKRVIFTCEGCGVRVSAAPPPAGTRYRCKKCGKELVAAQATGASVAPGQLAMREAKDEDVQSDIDRALAAYLKQKNMARRDQLRECLRLQIEFARYGLVVPLLELLRRSGAITWQQQHTLEGVNFSALVQDPEWKKQAIPGYRLLGRIAIGGYATIYAAQAAFGGGRVVVKVLHPERAKDERTVARFEREANLLRRFNCPHIVRGMEYGSDRGHHYLVMEHVEGKSLGQALSEIGAFPPRGALQATRQIAEALRYLHAEGYLHRDVKPDNALIDGEGRVRLCDLGFAAPIPEAPPEGQRAATVVGTPGYVSPETARGEADVKVGGDIYALGILLFALLTGHEPFAGASSEEMVADQIDKNMPVPNLMAVQASPEVVQFLKRVMHPDRLKRFRTMVEVVEALDKLIAAG